MHIVFRGDSDPESPNVVVDIYPFRNVKHGIRLLWNCKTVVERHAMVRACREAMDNSVRNLARKAYECGYRDGRSHNRKKKFFPVSLNASDVAW
jgi:hypothetical protein